MNKNKVVVVMGRKRSGKDSYLDALDEKPHFKFAYKIKKLSHFIFGKESDTDDLKEKFITVDKEYLINQTIKNFIELFDLENNPNHFYSSSETYKFIYSKYEKYIDGENINISPRVLHQVFGTEICKNVDTDIFVKGVNKSIDKHFNNDGNSDIVYITDGRFFNELNYLAKNESFELEVLFLCRYKYDNKSGLYQSNNLKYDHHYSEYLNNTFEAFSLDILNNKLDKEKLDSFLNENINPNIKIKFIAKEWLEQRDKKDLGKVIFEK